MVHFAEPTLERQVAARGTYPGGVRAASDELHAPAVLSLSRSGECNSGKRREDYRESYREDYRESYRHRARGFHGSLRPHRFRVMPPVQGAAARSAQGFGPQP